ncbi:MAG: 50S ribosomal protein L1 [Planctomycetota bacterium]|nr:MAG: 50S ribosomal protein L1 [Planctomycetota bacterium]
MPKRSVHYQVQLSKAGDLNTRHSIPEAVKLIKEMGEVRPTKAYKGARERKGFDQTIELVMSLGIDPKQADQMVRGSISLPKGIGKTKIVIVFCPDELIEESKTNGAVEAGNEDLIKKISDGWLDFDVAIAHPSQMGKVGKLGRVLGPQGKMPSPKSGTVTPDVVQAVKDYSAGKLEFRNDAGGNIHAIVGKMSFSHEDLQANIEAFIGHIRKLKPVTAKGQYIKRVCLSGTMTPSVALDVG